MVAFDVMLLNLRIFLLTYQYSQRVVMAMDTTLDTADRIAPTVSSVYPATNGFTGIPVGSDLVFTFNEAIQRGVGTIALQSSNNKYFIGVTVVASYDAATSGNLTISDKTLTINPSDDLASGSHNFVTFDVGSIKDLAGNSYIADSRHDFYALEAPDTIPPTVDTVYPANGLTGVAIESDIVITFDEAIQRVSGIIAIHIDSATGPVVVTSEDSMTADVLISGSTLTINPSHDFAPGTHYFVTLSNGSVKDLSGNAYLGSSAYEFTTVMPPSIPNITHGSDGGSSTGIALAGVGALAACRTNDKETGHKQVLGISFYVHFSSRKPYQAHSTPNKPQLAALYS